MPVKWLSQLSLLLLLLMPVFCLADESLDQQFPPAEGTSKAEFLSKYRARLRVLEQGFQELKLPVPAVLTLEEDNIACLLESPYFAQFNAGQRQQRFLVGRLVVLNQSAEPLELPLETLRLLAGDQEYRLIDSDEQRKFASMHLNGKHYSLNEIKPADKLVIPPGQVASSWVAFNGLDPGNDVPPLTLRWTMSGLPYELDVKQQHQALLRWKKERVGPHGIVAIGTISGEVNTISLGTIIDELLILSTERVSRVVIQFSDEAPVIDNHLLQWLREAARKAGLDQQQNHYSELPVIPPLVRELHLAKLPGQPENSSNSAPAETSRVHHRLSDAYLAAAKSAYEVIDIKLLTHEIQHGHPLSRCAALSFGAIRLPPGFLTEVIRIVEAAAASEESKETVAIGPYQTDLKKAAITALGEFNDPRAVEILRKQARQRDKVLAEAALNSLGASRFPAHQEALLELLQSAPELQTQVVQTLARYPKKRWAEALYEHASSGAVPLRKEALQALNVIGHPQLNSLLKEILEKGHPDLRTLAINLLSSRDDPQSQEMVIQFALKALEKSYDQQAAMVVTRFKVQQAIPALLRALNQSENHRQAIIQTLSVIGDDRILDDLVTIYPQLKPQEKVVVLRTLAQINQPRFLEFSRSAIQTEEMAVVGTLAQLLQESASLEAVDILVSTLKNSDEKESRYHSLLQALGNLSTPQSREFLIQLRDSGSRERRQAARNALETLYYRSPANNIYQQAVPTANSGNHTLAILQFTVAIESDAYFPHAYAGRAESYRATNQLEESLADYTRLIELDAQWPTAQAGRGHVLTSLSRFEEALPHLTAAIEQDDKNPYLYSARAHAYSMLERFEPAETDYRKALELDPEHMTALTGVALSLAIAGKIDEAAAMLEKGKAEYSQNSIFAYNSACTYARAAEYLQKQGTDTDKQKEQVISLVDAALDELERSIPLGYSDAEWTQNDPDLKILREQARFAKALEQMNQKSKTDNKPKSRTDQTEDASAPAKKAE